MTSRHCLAIVVSILGVYFVLSSSEMIMRRSAFARGGLLDWEVVGLRYRARLFSTGALGRRLDWLFAYRQTVRMLVVPRLVAGLGLCLTIPLDTLSIHVYPLLLLTVACTSALLSYRNMYGNDGADQMAFIASVAFSAAYLTGGRSGALALALEFVSFQLMLSYVTASVAKLASRRWRDGSGLNGILSTAAYGSPWIFATVKRFPVLSIVLSWYVMLAQIAFPVLFVLGKSWLIAGMVLMATFHIMNAVVMRLHTFVWVFLSLYPAVLFTRGELMAAMSVH